MKAWLPIRGEFLIKSPDWFAAARDKRSIKVPLQPFNPLAQGERAANTETEKKMHMVGHKDVTPDTDVKLSRAPAISAEGGVNFGSREEGRTCVGGESHKINGRIKALKGQVQPGRFDLALHGGGFNAGGLQRTSYRERILSAETADATAVATL